MAAKKSATTRRGAPSPKKKSPVATPRRRGTAALPSGDLDSRSHLIDVALRVILERGIDAVRIEDIVAEVGVTKGSLYWHFEDRHGLIKAAIAEQIRRLSAETIVAVSDAIASSTSKDDYLSSIAPFLVDPFDADKVRDRWGRLGILVETRNDPELKELMRDVQSRHLEVVVELMTDAQRHGFLREDLDPRSVAVALSVINLGSIIFDVLGDKAPEPTDWWGLIWFFIEAMFPPGASRK